MREKDLVLKLAAIIGDEITQQLTPDDSEYVMFTSKFNLLYELDCTGTYTGQSLTFSLTDVTYDPFHYRKKENSLPWTYVSNGTALHYMIGVLMHKCNEPNLVALSLHVLKKESELIATMRNVEQNAIIQIRTKQRDIDRSIMQFRL